MSRWRLPRPVVGAKRIRRGSSVGGSKPPLAPNQTPASHHTLLLLSRSPLLSSPLNTPHKSLSLSLSLASLYAPTKEKKKKLGGGKKSPPTARRSQRKRAMSSSAAAAGDGGGKEKGACELCGAPARVYCGADEATLCWGCDAQVHGANFLVARHARALLCRGCARPTPWRAAGPRLGPTASLCDRCVRRGGGGGGPGVAAGAARAGGVGADVEMGAVGAEDEDDDDGEDEDDDEVVVEDDEEEEEEGEGENQVVPWTEDADSTPPPVASSTSSSSREAAANGANAADCAKEDVPCSTSPQPSLCQYSSPARHGGRSDEATSSRNGGRFLANRRRKRSPSDFLGSGSAQSGSGTPGRNCSNAGIGRNGFT